MFDPGHMQDRLEFIRRGGDTERYHTERRNSPNTVGHHSFNVAWLTALLTPGLGAAERAHLTMAALAHDLAEHITGDIPAPTKRAVPGLREAVGNMEAQLMAPLGFVWEAQLRPELLRVLKLADAMEGALYCIDEAALGNRRIVHIFDNFRSYIKELEPTGPVETALVEYIDQEWKEYNR